MVDQSDVSSSVTQKVWCELPKLGVCKLCYIHDSYSRMKLTNLVRKAFTCLLAINLCLPPSMCIVRIPLVLLLSSTFLVLNYITLLHFAVT